MIRADSAVVGAAFLGFGSWITYALAYFAVFVKSFEEFVVRPVDIFEMTVIWAVFRNNDLPFFFQNCGVKSFETLWTKAGCMLYDVRFGFLLLFV
jgi:hypothetical protein